MEHRAVVVGADRDALLAGLADPASWITGQASTDGKTAFLFSGQGSQWAGMGRELYAAYPVFAAAFDEVRSHLDIELDDELIDQTGTTQPALFAIEVALFRLLDSWGVRPDFVAGHSIGELAAAHVAGVFSLEDACRLVVARGRLMQELPSGGAMYAIGAPESEVLPLLVDGVAIAAVNGPRSVVISGLDESVTAIAEELRARDVRVKRLATSHAFHSPLMDPMLDAFREVASSIEFREPVLAMVSDQVCSPEYWVTHVREAVRFHDDVQALRAAGVSRFVEVGPGTALTSMVAEAEAESVLSVPLLRKDRHEPTSVVTGLAHLYVSGVAVDWTVFFAASVPSSTGDLDLPTYAFDHQRYWLDAGADTGDVASLGLRGLDHPLLRAGVALAAGEGDGFVFTGRLSLRDQPWLADHRVLGRPVVPAAALVELVLRAGAEAGCGAVRELVVHAPVVLPEIGGVQIQVAVGGPDPDGSREFDVFVSDPDGAEDEAWSRRAGGRLAVADELSAAGDPLGDLAVWPPAGAEPVSLDGAYAALAEAGLGYGAAFQGLRAVWRAAGTVFAEVALPEQVQAGVAAYGLHPALLDAAIQAIAFTDRGEDAAAALPFAFNGITLWTGGATTLRVRIALSGTDTAALDLADGSGRPVASVQALTLRPLSAAGMTDQSDRDSLYRVDLIAAPAEASQSTGNQVVVDVTAFDDGDADLAVAARRVLDRVLAIISDAANDASETAADLVFVVPDPSTGRGLVFAGVPGLVRSAMLEVPDRFRLIEVLGTAFDDLDESVRATALAVDEPAVVIRDGAVFVPRLTRATTTENATPSATWNPSGTVLITGGTGGLGGVVARHLVLEHGVKHLLLVSRRGPAADGAEELRSGLTDLGATVTITACDVADREAVSALLESIPAEAPLSGVVHAAGVVSDGLLSSLSAEQFDTVWRPKAQALVNLDEATRDLDLSAFVVFSSLAGVLGGAGQANYAAANTFIDALVTRRRAEGRVGLSLSWGLWEQTSGMGAQLSEADLQRMARGGIAPLAVEQALRLFDVACAGEAAHLVPARLLPAALREAAATSPIPPLLRGLVSGPRRSVRAVGQGVDGVLRSRLLALPLADRDVAMVRLVRAEAAAVLGHSGVEGVVADRGFLESGFDSLTALELRRRLAAATGLSLSATVMFDYPTPSLMAGFLLAELLQTASAAQDRASSPARIADEPIAIVGVGCRYPGGVSSPEDLWELVASGRDAVGGFPTDRGWDLANLYHPDPDHRGTTYSDEGGFLYDAAEFDPGFFGISPREALGMDPQQRLLLETSWEACERAGLDPATLRGSATGVFVGVMYNDYASRLREVPEGMEGYVGNGSSPSIASGRISYSFGFEGPAMTVDTACSSSLVAMHLAAQALRRGECDLALAGGATVMSTPGVFIGFSRQRGLSPTGRCHSFSDDADGTGWGEGAGMLLLERLSDAQAKGHQILAVVRGTAVNQDGASSGLTAPNGPSQQRVIRAALADAGLTAADVDAVEAHGTGTSLGDPIEAQALLTTYGRGRPDDAPLWLGSVKSNLGHTQAAAGVAGVIKMLMAMRHETLPQTLHVAEPSSHVDWTSGAVELLTESREWPAEGRPRRAGVSAFGISGTNAHVIIEQAPEVNQSIDQTRSVEAPVVPWVVSARSEAALAGQVSRLADYAAARSEVGSAAIGRSLLVERSQMEHRAVVVGADRDALLGGLADPASWITGQASTDGKTAFLFSGQGSQWAGMGRELHAAYPVFAAAFDEVCSHFDIELDDELIDQTGTTQPALFAIEVALFRLLESWGVRPDFVAGHSIGELAAAYVAGVFSLPDACRLVCARGRLMQALPSGGAMYAVGAPESEVLPLLVDGVAIAAVNGPRSVVISGLDEAVTAIAEQLRALDVRVKRLATSHAFHSPLMDPMLDAFGEVARSIEYHEPHLPMMSDQVCSPEYWVTHVREAVRFHDEVQALRAAGVTRFVEVGPGTALTSMVAESSADATSVAMLRKGRPEAVSVVSGLARLHVDGAPVDWEAFFAPVGDQRVDLPTYAFDRQRFWLEDGAAAATDSLDDEFWDLVERGDLAGLGQWRSRRSASEVAGWLYGETWRPAAADSTTVTGATVTGTWLVAGAAGATNAEQVARALEARGAESATIVDFDAERLTIEDNLAGIVLLTGGQAGIAETDDASVGRVVAVLQALVEAGSAARLWCVTSGITIGTAGIWGLGRVAALELPGTWGGVIDAPTGAWTETVAEALVTALAATAEPEALVQPSGDVLVRRLVPAPAATVAADAGPWTPSGTILVSGGTGALGGHVARWLVTCPNVERVVLLGRRGMATPGALELLEELSAYDVVVSVMACDVADQSQVAEVLGGIDDLTAVVHAAGVVDDGVLAGLTPERVAGVLSGKAAGAIVLDELTRDHDLDAFVVFSSFAGMVGSAGQGLYAAANAVCDAVVARRRELGLAAVSMGWGPWAGEGMAGVEGIESRQRRGGVTAMDPTKAVQVLGLIGASRGSVGQDFATTVAGSGAVLVADVDWERFGAQAASGRPLPMLAEIPGATGRQNEDIRSLAPLAEAVAQAPAEQRYSLVLDAVCALAGAILGHGSGAAVSTDRAFRDLGFDSLTAVEFGNALSARTGLRLAGTAVFDYPTPQALAEYVAAALAGERVEQVATVTAVRTDEPVAIVAMGCRFPGGVSSPQQLWELVARGVDAMTALPDDRGWDPALSASAGFAPVGAFLNKAAEFDAGFFGINPREALAMDPQQRLLLETSWEVLENAGLDPQALKGSATGVFVGTNGQDYAAVLVAGEEDFTGYQATGNSASVVSGRISYSFGFEGPAMTVDTACSASLVAMHLAAQALRRGECDLALAGGATVMSTPGIFAEFSRQGALAADGRCKAFSEDADGTGWGEGVGMLLLERLSDARANGHRILAVVAGSAVNQDGASNGLTAPNGPSQQRVIRAALADAGVSAAEVDVVEAHGTGTALGDPIEAQALLATYGQDREADRPLWLGSIKSNVGHTQAAAGVAGVMKMVLAMGHSQLPPTLHVSEPSRQVDWSAGAVELLTESRDWPAVEGRLRRAGVSSFGISGTNAHVVLEEAPQEEPAATGPDNDGDAGPVELPVVPWVVSARSEAGLRGQFERLAGFVADQADLTPGAIGRSLVSTRGSMEHRGVVVGTDRDALLAGLADPESWITGRASGGKTAFLFSGQGSQWAGMGRELHAAYPVFAAAFDEVCSHFDIELNDELIDQTAYTQPALFALEVALFRLLETWGVQPDFVAGHSIGELAAAYIAGVFSLEDACRLVSARGRLMQALPSGGAMYAIGAPESDVVPLLMDGVAIAAVNGPQSVVISGLDEAVTSVAEYFRAQDVRVKRLATSHAFHSPLMDPMLDAFGEVARSIEYREPLLPVVSNVTGEIATAEQLCSPEYWVRHVREAVRFADGVQALSSVGVTRFVEVGPGTALTSMVAEVPDAATAVPMLRKGRPEPVSVVSALARLHVDGGSVDWEAFFAPVGDRYVELPTYAFERRRFWPTQRAVTSQADTVDSEFWELVERGDLAGLGRWRSSRAETVAGRWIHDEAWRGVPSAEDPVTGAWLVLCPAGSGGSATHDELLRVLETRGAYAVTVHEIGEGEWERGALAARFEKSGPAAGVVLLAADSADAVGGEVWIGRTLAAIQGLADADTGARLWCVTSGAVLSDSTADIWSAGVWGLGRVAGLEIPGVWGGVIDVPHGAWNEAIATAVVGVLAEGGESEARVTASGEVSVRRLVSAPAVSSSPDSWTPSGTVLVSGGTGALGGHVARWLVSCAGVERVVLASRRGPDAPGAADLVAELTGDGSTAAVEVVACDVTDREQVAGLLASLDGLSAVIHAAGAVDDGVLTGLAPERVAGVVGAKAAGALLLDELTRDRGLEAFVVFSSFAGMVGSAGQGLYAAANAVTDAVVARRRAHGLAAVAVGWGPWAGAGMAGKDGIGARQQRGGLSPMDPAIAVQALGLVGAATRAGSGGFVVADVDWERFGAGYHLSSRSRLLAEIPGATPSPAELEESARAQAPLAAAVAQAPAEQRNALVLDAVCTLANAVLGHGSGTVVEPDRAFRDIGFDSLTAVEFGNVLSARTGLRFAGTTVFDYPTPQALADHVAGRLSGDGEAGGAAAVLAELDRLEASILGISSDPDVHSALRARLRVMLSKVDTAGGASAPEDASQRIGTASDEELFRFIHDELGRS